MSLSFLGMAFESTANTDKHSRTNSPCNKSQQAFSALSSPTDPAHREPQ